ncbi:MAG: ROK family protein [Solirubrobacteraceae bacterium]
MTAGGLGRPGELIVGVDVGGTKVSVATLRDGRLGDPKITPTDLRGADQVIGQIVDSVLNATRGETLAAVGIGVPSVVEFATGLVRSSVNIPLQDVPLRRVLEKALGVPVFVDNDATVAALAEAHDEQGRLDVRHLVMLTIGTGIGGGIVIGGRPYRGATGGAGEVGHTLIGIEHDIPAATKHFPQPGSLEALAAGHELDRLTREAASANPQSKIGLTLAKSGKIAGPETVAAARAGDAVAIELLALLGRRVGIGVANAINTFDPDVVAIGGGVSAAGEFLLEPATQAAWEYVREGLGTKTEIRLARSGPKAGVRGAALLARSELHPHSDPYEKETR